MTWQETVRWADIRWSDVSAILSSIVWFERPRDILLGEMSEAGTLKSTEFNRNRFIDKHSYTPESLFSRACRGFFLWNFTSCAPWWVRYYCNRYSSDFVGSVKCQASPHGCESNMTWDVHSDLSPVPRLWGPFWHVANVIIIKYKWSAWRRWYWYLSWTFMSLMFMLVQRQPDLWYIDCRSKGLPRCRKHAALHVRRAADSPATWMPHQVPNDADFSDAFPKVVLEVKEVEANSARPHFLPMCWDVLRYCWWEKSCTSWGW